MKSVLMSIRANISATIFKSWTKRLEYRTRWNPDFKGRVYVYESGKDGGKVAGFFDVERIITTGMEKVLTPDDWKILDDLDQKNFDTFFQAKNIYKNVYAIEIKNPHVFKPSITLEEFNSAYKVNVQRAPQSWQYIEVNDMELFDERILGVPVELETPPEGVTPTEQFMKKER